MLSFGRIEDRPVEALVARLPDELDVMEDEDPADTVAARLENDAAGKGEDEDEKELVLEADEDKGSSSGSTESRRSPSPAGLLMLAPLILRGSLLLTPRRVAASRSGVEGGEVADERRLPCP